MPCSVRERLVIASCSAAQVAEYLADTQHMHEFNWIVHINDKRLQQFRESNWSDGHNVSKSQATPQSILEVRPGLGVSTACSAGVASTATSGVWSTAM